MRLEQILFLKSFGFTLEEIKDKILDLKTAPDFKKMFFQQRKVLIEQIENLNHTVKMLDAAIAETLSDEDINIDRVIMILESMKRGNPYTFAVRYFDDDQLKNYALQLIGAPDNMDYVKDIFYHLEQLYETNADPAGEDGQELAKRWWSMANQFTEGDVKLLKSLIYVGQDIGSILNVASMAALYPLPYYSVYGATKAFVLSFTEALRYEMRHTKLKISCLCPGDTDTNFFHHAGNENKKTSLMPPQLVAETAVMKLMGNVPVIFPGSMKLVSKIPGFILRRIVFRRVTTYKLP